jgi:hypothetical protein
MARALQRSTLALLLCSHLMLSGCEDKRRHSAAEGVMIAATTRPIAADAPPEQVALELVRALSEAQIARSKGLGLPGAQAAYDAALSRVLALIDEPTIQQYVTQSGSMTLPKNVSQSAAITAVVESWMSVLAHYAGGIVEDSLAQRFVDPKGAAIVYLEAVNPTDRETLHELALASSKLVPGASATQPATRAEDSEELRKNAISKGIVPSLAVGITVTLAQSEGHWLVTRLTIGQAQARMSPSMLAHRNAVATSQPQSQPASR